MLVRVFGYDSDAHKMRRVPPGRQDSWKSIGAARRFPEAWRER